MDSNVEVKGVRELEQALADLEHKVARQIGGNALRAGARVIQQGAKENAPVKSGALQKAIKVKTGKSKDKEYRSVVVGVGEKWFVGDEFYAAFIEFGHLQGSRKLGDKRDEIPGEHFVEYAYDERSKEALDVTIATLGEQIDKHTAKGAE